MASRFTIRRRKSAERFVRPTTTTFSIEAFSRPDFDRGDGIKLLSLMERKGTSEMQHGTCKVPRITFIPVPQRVFEVAPLVPGFPSLDAKPHSSGVTRREVKEEVRFKN
jgi:hypothetical protein